ncbi:MAG TPA: glycosyltransferase family 25 protein [Burkholderiaceae bacterium]|nr:glycosyltransferase family 25 protein [Burkholderiaceae bacterium]
MLVLINLDGAVERRRSMAAQLQAHGLAFERIGIDLRAAPIAAVTARVAEQFPRLRFDAKALSGAEIGCWLSHLSAWQRLLERRSERAATIIEDDLLLAPAFADTTRVLVQDSRFDVVYLGTSSRNLSNRRQARIGDVVVHEPVGVILNTWGYRVTRSYVEKFFAAMTPARTIRLPIDHFIGGRATWARPTIAVLRPAVVVEDPVLGVRSQIGPYTRRIDRLELIEGMRRMLLASPLSEAYYAWRYRHS